MTFRKWAVPVTIFIVALMVGVLASYSGVVGVCPPMPPEACIAIYDPVYGVPTFRAHSNSCVACAEGAWFWIKT